MKLAGALCFVLALALGGVWIAHGMHMATLKQKLVETQVKDEFGDTVTQREWQDTFEIGLDIVGPAGGGLVLLGGGLLWAHRRRQRT